MDQKPQDLTPALAEACEKIRELLAKADLGDACARYDVGAIIARVKADPDTFGRKAVDRLERVLGRGRSSLYRYGQVAERWDESAFLALQERKSAAGLPLTWKHFEVLAGVADEAASQALIDAALAKDLTTGQLASLIREGRRARAADAIPPEVARAKALVDRLAACADKLAAAASRWEKDVSPVQDREGGVPPELLVAIEHFQERWLWASAVLSKLGPRLRRSASAASTQSRNGTRDQKLPRTG